MELFVLILLWAGFSVACGALVFILLCVAILTWDVMGCYLEDWRYNREDKQ